MKILIVIALAVIQLEMVASSGKYAIQIAPVAHAIAIIM